MKILFFAFISLFLFTGCYNYDVSPNQEFFNSKLLFDLKKVQNQNITIIENNSQIMSRSPIHHGGGALTFNTDIGKLSQKASEEYFKQYFNFVSVEKQVNPNNLTIESHIKDYIIDNGFFFSFSQTTAIVNIKVYQHGSLILDKDYTYIKNVDGTATYQTTKIDLVLEVMHEAVLNVFKFEFQKDLLLILKNQK